MKFEFEIEESSWMQHTVEADSLTDAENQIKLICHSGNLNAQKHGNYNLNIKLIRVSNY